MRSLSTEFSNALAERYLQARDFIWTTAINLDTEDVETAGFWSDVGTVTAEVIDGITGATVERIFTGSHTLLEVSEIRLVSDISVREVTVKLSILTPEIETLLRGYDLRNQPIQIYRGAFDPATGLLAAPAIPRFVGFVDRNPIITPEEGSYGSAALVCVSHSRELTRTNPDVRSDASQQARAPGDRFYRYTGAAHEFEIFWGAKQGKKGADDGS